MDDVKYPAYVEWLGFYEFLDGNEPTEEAWEDWQFFLRYLDEVKESES